MIPSFGPDSGALPPGEHHAEWDEVRERFRWNRRRRQLLDGLAEGLAILAEAGWQRVWINGSFVTTKEELGDFPSSVDRDVLEQLGPELLDLSAHRSSQKRRFGGEFLLNVG